MKEGEVKVGADHEAGLQLEAAAEVVHLDLTVRPQQTNTSVRVARYPMHLPSNHEETVVLTRSPYQIEHADTMSMYSDNSRTMYSWWCRYSSGPGRPIGDCYLFKEAVTDTHPNGFREWMLGNWT